MTRSADISPLSVLLSRVDAVADGTPSRDTIPSGFPSLDKMLGGGFRRGDLVVLGGDVASGKSALALAFATRASIAGLRAAFFTAEMNVERVLERIMAMEARTRIDDLRQGTLDDVTRASAGAIALKLREHLPILETIPADGSTTLAALLEELPELDLLIVDSIAALAPGSGTRSLAEEHATVVRELKAVAVERSIAVVATASLPQLTPRADHRPILDDFGALGAVKQHADVVLALFREDMYESSRHIAGATELLVRKNRNGPLGYVDLFFYSQWMRFEDMLDPDR